MKNLLSTVSDSLATRRAARADRRSLDSELAAYTTEAQILDVEATLARHSEEHSPEIRSVLASRFAA